MNLTHTTYDVLILGGGIAACATAIALKKNRPELKVLVVERKPRIKRNKGSMRIGESLSPQSFQYLQELGLWEAFQEQRFDRSYGTSAAWGSSQMYQNEFMLSPFGYGWNLDRKAFDDFMISEAIEKDVDITFNTQLGDYIEIDKTWEVCLHKNERVVRIQARFIVDATGKKAAFACSQGVIKEKVDSLVGAFRFYEFPLGHENTSQGILIESDVNGWWYSTHLARGRFLVAYMTDADIARETNLKNNVVFETELHATRHTGLRLIGAKPLGDVRLGAAHSQYLSTLATENWLAVGDAAMSYDPLSSMGMLKGLSSGLFGAYAVLDSLQGNNEGIQKYIHVMQSQWNSYMKKRHSYYLEEQRFSETPFWKRRASLPQNITNQSFKTTYHETSIA